MKKKQSIRSLTTIYVFCIFSLSLILFSCTSQKQIHTDILIAGGGASGVSAAIQAARSGLEVILVEETPWLGGMLTAAGVSATDGNHKLPSGIWGEFREKLYKHYGSPEKLATGWVSNTQFEPWVGDSIFKAMASEYKNLHIYYGYHLKKVKTRNRAIRQVVFTNEKEEEINICPQLAIDATELGDLAAYSGCTYSLGQDAESETGEASAPPEATPYIQDLTYTVILKDYGKTAPQIKGPEAYDYSEFSGCCKQLDPNPESTAWDCAKMMEYGKLPNDYYMINWPIHGNDSYLNVVEMSYYERKEALKKAKNTSLAFVAFLQNIGGFDRFGLAEKYPTTDHLPFIPYHREGRRVKGKIRYSLKELMHPYQNPNKQYYMQGIAVGDYPLDHHHEKNPLVEKEVFPKVPSFNVPFGCLIPEEISNLVLAEKSISVTHVVNGCTRLQPCVMLIGQAAGEIATLSVQTDTKPAELNIRMVQEELLKANCWLMPFVDIRPEDHCFEAIQKTALAGWMRGEGISVGWANETRFYPDKILSEEEVLKIIKRVQADFIAKKDWGLKEILSHFLKKHGTESDLADVFLKDLAGVGGNDIQIDRKTLAIILNSYCKPFEKKLFIENR